MSNRYKIKLFTTIITQIIWFDGVQCQKTNGKRQNKKEKRQQTNRKTNNKNSNSSIGDALAAAVSVFDWL